MYKSQRFSEHLKASLEQRVEDAVVENDVVDGNVENHLLAANESMRQLNDLVEEGDDLSRASAQLESILNDVQSEEDGLDPVSAKFVSASLEAITHGWGLEESLVPSAESFGGAFSRKEATASLEANVRSIIDQIITFLKKVWTSIRDFVIKVYDHLFNAAKLTERRAKNLKERSVSLTGAPKEAEIDITALAWRFDGSDPVSASQMLDAFKVKAAALKERVEETNKLSDEFSKLFEDLANGDKGKFEAAYKRCSADFEKKVKDFSSQFKEAHSAKGMVLPNGSTISVKVEGEAGDRSVVFTHENGKGPGKTAVKIKTLSPAQIKTVASNVETFAVAAYNDMKSSIQAQKDRKNFLTVGRREYKEVLDRSQGAQLSKLSHRWASFYSALAKMDVDITRAMVSSATAILATAEQSAKQYGKGAAKAAEEKKEDKKAK